MPASPPTIPLPRHWKRHVKSGLLHAVALAHHGITIARGWCANSRIARVRLAAESDRLKAEVAMLREEIRIKDERLALVAARQRPHYPPHERMAILTLQAARGWNAAQVAKRFLLTAATIARWHQRLEEHGQAALVRVPEPVHKFPEFVTALVQRLKTTCPQMGKVRIANVLARAGLHLAPSTARRMLKRAPCEPPAQPPTEFIPTSAVKPRTVVARYPHHVWNLDLTAAPISDGLWAPWFSFALPQVWPFCATDQGSQFQSELRVWCASHHVKPRYGAIGHYGSISVIERFNLTLKAEGLAGVMVPLHAAAMRSELLTIFRWYNLERPHMHLAGATPEEVLSSRRPANRRPRLEPRARYPAAGACAAPQVRARTFAARLTLVVSDFEGATHLPVVRLKTAA